MTFIKKGMFDGGRGTNKVQSLFLNLPMIKEETNYVVPAPKQNIRLTNYKKDAKISSTQN